MQIRKRDGRIEEFNNFKIHEAIKKAYISTGQKYDNEILNKIASQVEEKCYKKINVDLKNNITNESILKFDTSTIPTVEEIQNLVEIILMDINPIVAKSYIRYRYKREVAREYTNEFFDEIGKKLSGKYVQNQNANVDEASFGGRIGEATSHMMKTYALNFLMSPMSKKNHEENMIYIHDLDHYPVGDHNCMSIPFDKLLANGFNTRQTDVRPANSVSTAFQLVAVIFQLQSLQQFGGTSATHLDWTMVPYVRKSFFKHFKNALDYLYNSNSEWLIAAIENDKIENISIDDKLYDYNKDAQHYALQMTLKEINQSVEGLYHNLNTLQSRSGNQLPFTSLNYGTCTLPEGRMITRAILEKSIEGIGKVYRTPIFPCGIFQVKAGINRKPQEPNYDLFLLALESTAKRLYPNYVNVDWSGNQGYDINDPTTIMSTINSLWSITVM